MSASLYDRLDIPEHDRATSLPPDAAAYLQEFVRKQGFRRTLEIGMAYGCSTAHIIEATRARHVAIDPYQEAYGGNLGVRNLERVGLVQHLDLRRELSRQALPRLADEGAQFDFVLVDGGHRFDEVFVDFALCDPLLLQGGCIVLDDAWMGSVRHTAGFIRANRADYEEVESAHWNFFIFRKTGKDERPWDHFKEFCGSASPGVAGWRKRGPSRGAASSKK